jgi:hypothetical protein
MAIGYEEAAKLAREHLASQRFPDANYRWIFTEGRTHPDGWYFSYIYHHVAELPRSQWKKFFGAPGFVVHHDDGRIRTVSREEWHRLKLWGTKRPASHSVE